MFPILIMYVANVLLAGWISISSLFYPKKAHLSVFTGNIAYSEVIRLVGALWWAIFVLSMLGLFFPKQMSLVLVFQLIYKSTWLLFVAVPARLSKAPYPKAMATTFLIWVVVLPFVIPWSYIFV